MMSLFARTLLLTLLLLPSANAVVIHCQVPCGIYADQRRFERMLEDHETVAKAIANIGELADKTDPQSVNQVVRWVTNKEEHAQNTQMIIAEYFMAQRIKAPANGESPEDYHKKLAAAHAVTVSAMKCKQSADPATAEAFRKAILDFYRAYEGREPAFSDNP